MMPPSGTHVTWISRVYDRRVRGEVTVSLSPDAFRATTNWAAERVLFLADEGVTWIRGWHDEGSTEDTALSAAFALAVPHDPGQFPPQLSYDALVARTTK
jgi:hypothetical protein